MQRAVQQSSMIRLVMVAMVLGMVGCDRRSQEPVPRMQPEELSLAYTIELEDGDGVHAVNEGYGFRDDDRFRLQVEADFAAYLYIFNRSARDDFYVALFPHPDADVTNPVAGQAPVTLPGTSDWYRMDSDSGGENLVFVAATRELEAFGFASLQIPATDFDDALAAVERQMKPASSRRYEDGETIRLFAASGNRALAITARLALAHEERE